MTVDSVGLLRVGTLMVAIDRDWWEFLAPTPMHRRLAEVTGLLNGWCQTPYGTFWLKTAIQERGVIRVKPGQPIPVIQFIALGDQPIFIAPQQAVRDGHRMVGPDQFASGTQLGEGELALAPRIQLDVVTDRALIEMARRGELSARVPLVNEPSHVFSAPARLLISPRARVKRSYTLYQHIFGAGPSYPDDGYFYVGVSTRSWQKRWAEHRRATESGSPLLFHRRFREELANGLVAYVHHKVMAITDDIEELYAAEEYLVREHWDDARRLNMIPGGKSGLKYLRENGLLPERTIPLPDERDKCVEAWLREHPRKGLPAPWVSEKWKDDEWAIAQICGRDGRLSPEQVRSIRKLAVAHSATTIAERIGALNKEQVQRVIDGDTYERVT